MTLPWTPQEILDGYGVDVFAETVGKLTFPPEVFGVNQDVIPRLQELCWQRFRNRPIGDYDYRYWLQMLDDRARTAFNWYSRAAGKHFGNLMEALDTSRYSDTSSSSDSHTNVQGTENEKLPDTPAPTEFKYLSDRSKTTGTVEGNNGTSSNGTRTDGNNAEALNRLMDALKGANVAFVRELDPLFMNRW